MDKLVLEKLRCLSAGAHFGVRNSLSIAFLAISDRYATLIFVNFFTKWLPAAIWDVQKSLLVKFLAISDQYKTFYFLQNGCRRPF